MSSDYELHPKLQRFAKRYTAHVGPTITQQRGGSGFWREGRTLIDIGSSWGPSANDYYVDRLVALLDRFKAGLVFDTRGHGWTIETDPDRGVTVQTLYNGWLFDHDYCKHALTPDAKHACEYRLPIPKGTVFDLVSVRTKQVLYSSYSRNPVEKYKEELKKEFNEEAEIVEKIVGGEE